MVTENLGKEQIVASTSDAVAQLTALMLSVDDKKINTIPYAGSWTAPQLLTHVTKSINGMSQALLMPGKPAERDASERVEQLKSVFLNFSNKMNSPEFIVPEDGPYEKQPTIDKLNATFNQFKENANNINLTDLVEGLPFGPVTKLEILYFTLVHTQRHLEQMGRICESLKDK